MFAFKERVYFKDFMFIGKNNQQASFDSQFFGPAFAIPENDPYLLIERKIEWDELLDKLKKNYSYEGKQSIPVKNLVLLLLFKHYNACSDVEIVELLAGSLPMQKALNITFMEAQIKSRKEFYFKKSKKKEIKIKGYINPSTLSKFRSKIGLEGVEMITQACDKFLPKKKTRTAIADTTVSPSNIAYPTDINLLEKARTVVLRNLQELSTEYGLKFRTYSRKARRTFLNYIKLGKKKRKESRKVQGKMIRFLARNLKQLKQAYEMVLEKAKSEDLFKSAEALGIPKEIKTIETILEQQKELHKLTPRSGNKTGIHIKDRIVSIFKPHVRAMSRGKIPNPTEFGAKILLEMRNGFLTLLKVTFNNESDQKIIQGFFSRWKGLNVGTDRGMSSRENEKLAKEHGVKNFYAERKGKKSLEKTNGVKRIRKVRPAIEAKIGLAKRKFGLGRNLYKRGEEGESQWLHLCITAMNLRLFIRKAQL